MKRATTFQTARMIPAIAGLAVLLSCGEEPTTPPVSPPVTPPPPAQPEIPITGAAVPGMESYDQKIAVWMQKWAVPGGAVAVLRDGKLLYARGFARVEPGLTGELDTATSVQSFPTHDLFSTFP